jgi:hypothetical protein
VAVSEVRDVSAALPPSEMISGPCPTALSELSDVSAVALACRHCFAAASLDALASAVERVKLLNCAAISLVRLVSAALRGPTATRVAVSLEADTSAVVR